MDDGEDDSSSTPKAYEENNEQGFSWSFVSNQKVPAHDSMYSKTENEYVGDEEEEVDVEDEELGEGDESVNAVKIISKDNCDDGDDDDDDETDDDDDDDDVDEDDEGTGVPRKKRKLKSLISNYEFAPRVPTPTPALPVHQETKTPPSSGSGRRNSGADWSERETLVLVDAWGERFLKRGRKSLQLDEWQHVSERVSQDTGIERTDTQCRNRLDTLKKKYRREKLKLGTSNWPFYRKLDMMLNPPHPQQVKSRLSCGVDSGEYVFMDPKAFLERANGLDEMKDSPKDDDDDDDDGENVLDRLPLMNGRRGRVDGCFRLLADSIHKFSDIYEKIEVSKRKQMVELENMRMDFHRQLEAQRRHILETAQAEIAKIRQADHDHNDGHDLSSHD